MRYEFLNNNLFKKYKYKFLEIEKFIVKTYKLKDYRFEFDELNKEYYIYLIFKEFLVKIPITDEELNKTNKDYILNKINTIVNEIIKNKYFNSIKE